jgi:glycosyltransferase involved in cell wall biosynthesis
MASSPAVNFIAVSQAIRERAIGYGIPAEKVTVSYIGVDTERFKPAGLSLTQRKKRILFIGRMVEKKAPLLLIHAFIAVRKEIPDAELVMIGDGPLRKAAELFAIERKIPVKFLGTLPPAEIIAQLHEARVFCLPSVTAANGDAEGFGLVLLEAQACGVPVISSACGGAAEGLLNQKSGFQHKENCHEEIAALIIKLLSNDYLAESFSAQAVEFAKKNFELNLCNRLLEKKYNDSSCPQTSGASLH